MKKIKYTADRSYRDYYIEEEEVVTKKKRPILLNKNKNILQRLKEKIVFFFKV
jgi:hypothetical protein